jgi:hypothetical protein
VFGELDTRQDAGGTVSLEWEPHAGETKIVVARLRAAGLAVSLVHDADPGNGFHHAFRDRS